LWDIPSDQGRLNSVLLHDARYTALDFISALSSFSIHQSGQSSIPQIGQLINILKSEGIKVYELSEIIKRILADSSQKDRKKIIKMIWDNGSKKPKPEKLTSEHVLYGYPNEPWYDDKKDRFELPDSMAKLRFNTYARDPMFGTPIGHVFGRLKLWRVNETKALKVAHKFYPILNENIKIIYDQNNDKEVARKGGSLEGGECIVYDYETILVGIGYKSNLNGFLPFMDNIFKKDSNKRIKYICAVIMPGEIYGDTTVHIDTTFNLVDEGKVLLMPYFYNSEIITSLPKRNILIKFINSYRDQLIKNGFSEVISNFYDKIPLVNVGQTHIYMRDNRGKPKLVKTEKNLIDFLIETGKLEKDGIIMIGGDPKGRNDINHLINALKEKTQNAGNILTIKPGKAIIFDNNVKTIETLEDHNINTIKLPFQKGLTGGPRCLTCPLNRDPT
jgi:arginine deiminase